MISISTTQRTGQAPAAARLGAVAARARRPFARCHHARRPMPYAVIAREMGFGNGTVGTATWQLPTTKPSAPTRHPGTHT